MNQSKYFKIFNENISLYRYFYKQKLLKIIPYLKNSRSEELKKEKIEKMRSSLPEKDIKALKKISETYLESVGNLTNIYKYIKDAFKGFIIFQDRTKEVTIEEYELIENRMYLPFLFSEFENYLSKALKYLLFHSQNNDELNNKKVKVHELIDDNKKIDFNKVTDPIEVNLKEILENKIEWDILALLGDYKGTFEKAKKLLKVNYEISNGFENLKFYRKIRNIYAHGDGTIDRRFLNDYKDRLGTDITIGDKFPLTLSIIDDASDLIYKMTSEFDRVLVHKHPELIFNE